MAESYEFEGILSRMLTRVPEGIDKREGSIVYDALAPTAYALAAQNYMIGYLTSLLFADTAEGEWLDRVVYDFGLTREQASRALRRLCCTDREGEPLVGLSGKRLSCNELTFVLQKETEPGSYHALCEQSGMQGNCYAGAVLPIDHIAGLGAALLAAEPLIPARDQEEDESLRARFYLAVRQSPFGGNKADYREKCLAIDGVGSCVVFGAETLGPGRVGLLLGDELGNRASETLIQTVQRLFGEQGEGLAPIGHQVSVATGIDVAVDVVASLRLKPGTSFLAVQPVVEGTIRRYIENLAFDTSTIFYAKLVSEILNAHEAILDVGAVTLNGAEMNLALVKSFVLYQLPVVGEITVTEVV